MASIATEAFRIDPRSGLQYHRQAEALIKGNAVAGVVFLLVGGILALLVSLTRVPFGTPSLLTGEQMRRIMKTLRERFDIRANAEISMEANPGTVTLEKLSAYREAGINRLSIGLQSTHDTLLRSIGRIHTFAQFE